MRHLLLKIRLPGRPRAIDTRRTQRTDDEEDWARRNSDTRANERPSIWNANDVCRRAYAKSYSWVLP